MSAPITTPDQRYIVVRGRLWRSADPNLSTERRALLVAQLMDARRAIAAANRDARRGTPDPEALAAARAAVDAAKQALGERGPVWWSDGAPDLNRTLVRNTPYAAWYADLSGGEPEPR